MLNQFNQLIILIKILNIHVSNIIIFKLILYYLQLQFAGDTIHQYIN